MQTLQLMRKDDTIIRVLKLKDGKQTSERSKGDNDAKEKL